MPGLFTFLGVQIKEQPVKKNPSKKEKEEALPFSRAEVLRVALNNVKSEEVLAAYLDKQARLHPEEYREAVQAYFKEKLVHRTGLMRHLSFFDSENNSSLSFGKVVQGFKDLGFEPVSAYLNTIIVIGGGILGTRKMNPPVEEAHNLTHPKSHTALFNQNLARPNSEVHEARMRTMISHLMNGREILNKEDIDGLVDGLGKKRSRTCTDELVRALLRPLQRVAFTNLMNLCGGSLREQDLEDFFMGTLFYAIAEPASVAHRVIVINKKGDENLPAADDNLSMSFS